MKLLQICMALTFLATPVMAKTLVEAFADITALNEVHAETNPDFTKTSQILDREILDRKNKVVGEVHDVLINADGSISSLYVDFDKTGFSQLVYLNYHDMRVQSSSSNYSLNFSDYQLELLMPQILADTATAAGNDDGVYSAAGMVGGLVFSEDGRRVGKVKTVLFNKNGSKAKGLLVEVAVSKTIALPITSITEVQTSSSHGRSRIFIDESYAKAVEDFLKS